ncbi:MAG TPA: PIG-L deacetylase family protein [Candidatus Caenarcaniphilales bacterium]
MLKLNLSQGNDLVYKVLCLGSHCDDIEIGCGGTILKLIENYKNLVCFWVVFSSNQQRAQEATASAAAFLDPLESKKIVVNNFRDGFFPFIGAEIKEYFNQLQQEFSPDLVFTHFRHDLHQDHRLISDLTWNTFRNNLILEYEIPKFDGDLGTPNFFVQLDESFCTRKVRYILDNFPSQRQKQWFTEETFLSLMRLRGIESNAPGKYAEAFYCRKMILE